LSAWGGVSDNALVFLLSFFVCGLFLRSPHGLIFKNVLEVMKLMATESSAGAIQFSAIWQAGILGSKFPSQKCRDTFSDRHILDMVRPRAKRPKI